MWHCGAVVKELLARADKPGSTPVDALYCFFVPFFFLFRLFFNTIFTFGLFFCLFLLLTLLVMNLDQYTYILSLSPEFYFGQGISKALDLHTG